MKAFTDGYDTYIGEDLADALKAREEHLGPPHDDVELDGWCELEPDLQKRIWYELLNPDDKLSVPAGADIEPRDESSVVVTASVREWIEHNGRGFLCSTEY
jgi:hypothetical protein